MSGSNGGASAGGGAAPYVDPQRLVAAGRAGGAAPVARIDEGQPAGLRAAEPLVFPELGLFMPIAARREAFVRDMRELVARQREEQMREMLEQDAREREARREAAAAAAAEAADARMSRSATPIRFR